MRNWRVQKFFNKRQSEPAWLHWWSISELKKLKADVETLIKDKERDGDYTTLATKLYPKWPQQK